MTEPTTAYIGLGSNLEDRNSKINKAVKILNESENIEVLRVSSIIETRPLADVSQPNYLNAVAEIKTVLSAAELYNRLTEIETLLGRMRAEKWSPRTIDLDLLLFGQAVIDLSDLTVPHPQMHLRSFVLKGLCQLNAQLQHPVMQESVSQLAARLNGGDFVLEPDVPQLISVAGIIGVGKTTLSKKLSGLLGGSILLESYDTNPFMPDVYAGRKEVALDSQLYFLTSRAGQLDCDGLKQGHIAVTDYIFDKELIYAKRLLNEQQIALYERIYPLFCEKVTRPALVLYLRDSSENCLKRILKRNRPYERKIRTSFLEALDSDYQQLFKCWKTCPVIRLSMSQFNCVRDDDIIHLSKQIRSYIAV